MRTLGAIFDTHGLLRPQALAALAGCDPIIHAGDVGTPDVFARLGALAPVHAVRGNVDHGAWSANLPVTQRIEIDGFRIYVLHILAELDPEAADNVDAVIYGHSHQPRIETKNGTLFFNAASHKSSGTSPEAAPARGQQVVRAEPMSTLDAELNDFGSQLAMLRGHAADRDG